MSSDGVITVYSDYICPFCYLGRKSLDKYQDSRGEPLEIDWHPFDLRARQRRSDGTIDDDVATGKDEEYYRQARENVLRLADKYDVEMAEPLRRDVDSFPAQAASLHVKRNHGYGDWLAFDEAILEALWRDGRDVGDTGVLVEIAGDVGLDTGEIRGAVTDEEISERVTGFVPGRPRAERHRRSDIRLRGTQRAGSGATRTASATRGRSLRKQRQRLHCFLVVLQSF